MSARPGAVVDVSLPANGGEHPNRFEPRVSVHLRAYWPPLATDEEVAEAIRLAVAELVTQVAELRQGDTRRTAVVVNPGGFESVTS